MLWLTDTFGDNNGVSMVLKSFHEEIKAKGLPIDIMVCSNDIMPDDHLIVLKPLGEYNVPLYREQPIRIQITFEIHHKFHDGEYDRVICSTEGPMGIAALYLKHAYSVNTYFYLHTDWIMFAKKVLDIEKSNINRFRRLLRAFYRNFDGLFVLNKDQEKVVDRQRDGIQDRGCISDCTLGRTKFIPGKDKRADIPGIREDDKVILFTGRVSQERGSKSFRRSMKELKKPFRDQACHCRYRPI